MAEKEPLVSVCIPVYNAEPYILKTLKSVLESTWSNLEVVVVDNASEDRTLEVVQSVQDERVRCYRNDTNLGMVGNWNKCVHLCQGEYVKLVPADDIVYPRCVEKSVRILMKHPEVSLVITGTDLINDQDKITGKYVHWPKRGIFDGRKMSKMSVMFNSFFGNPVCAMFRKKDFERVGDFDEELPYIPDIDLWMRLVRDSKVAMEPESLNAFRVRKGSNTGRLVGKGGMQYTKEHIKMLDKHIQLGTFPMNRAERAFSIGWRWLRNWILAGYVLITNRE